MKSKKNNSWLVVVMTLFLLSLQNFSFAGFTSSGKVVIRTAVFKIVDKNKKPLKNVNVIVEYNTADYTWMGQGVTDDKGLATLEVEIPISDLPVSANGVKGMVSDSDYVDVNSIVENDAFPNANLFNFILTPR